MTRLPLHVLHDTLDTALAVHPERRTLAEFRAPAWMVAAEAEALVAAQRIITPHAGIAALFPAQALLLDWHLSPSRVACTPALDKDNREARTIVFPGPTAARKGAYELRAVALELDVEIVLLGSELEGRDFWQGLCTSRGSGEWTQDAGAVVLPALLEDKPRALLAALVAGVPVIATPACGLGERPGVTTVPYGDIEALRQAVSRILQC